MDTDAYSKLTEREQEILNLVLSGNSSSKIAENLYITINTVKKHIQSIIIKLNAGDNDGNPPTAGSPVPRNPLPNGGGNSDAMAEISSLLKKCLLSQ